MIERWERDTAEKAAEFQRMAERLERVSITESVAGGAVRVTVDHNGVLTDIRMSDAVCSMEPAEIAANVMAAIRKAQSRYPGRLAEILADTVGTEDPAARHILARAEQHFPADPDESDDPDERQPLPPSARRPRPARHRSA